MNRDSSSLSLSDTYSNQSNSPEQIQQSEQEQRQSQSEQDPLLYETQSEFARISENMRRIQDLVVEGGNDMQITENMVQIRESLFHLQQILNCVRCQIQAIDANNLADHYNSTVTNLDDRLHPLYDRDNRLIANFPRTIREVRSMDAASINTLLTAFNMPTTGSLRQRQNRALRYIGVTRIIEVVPFED